MLRSSGRRVGDIAAVEEDASLGRLEQAGDQIEERGLAATGRPEQRIGAAIGQSSVMRLSAQSSSRLRHGDIAVAKILERDR